MLAGIHNTVVGDGKKASPSITGIDRATSNQKQVVTYQARLYRFSNSGDMRFQRIDGAGSAAESPATSEWFFALPQNVPSDDVATAAWVKFIQDNQNAVFRISGEKLEPDCDYYGSVKCVESIEVTDIQII